MTQLTGVQGIIGDDTNLYWDTTNKRLGCGTGTTVSAKVHSLDTTEQLRLGYDASNYWSSTVGSSGGLTLTGTGTGGAITITPTSAQNINLSESTVFSKLTATNAAAPTIASATTIAPTKRITFISGTTTVQTITAPSPISSGGGQITLIPTGIFTTNTSGNIALASTAVVNKALIMTYDTTTTKWYPSY